MCSLYLEACAVWRETARRARVPHTCDGCGYSILPSTLYLSVSFVFDGTASTEALCFWCWGDWEAFGDAHGMKPMPSGFWDTLEGCTPRYTGARHAADAEWSGALARIKARWRTSASGRAALANHWMTTAVGRSLSAARSIVTKHEVSRG